VALLRGVGYVLIALVVLFAGVVFLSRVVRVFSGGNLYALWIALGMIAVLAARWTWVRRHR
jgi:multidrug transporter EmrE-like cation transporter